MRRPSLRARVAAAFLRRFVKPQLAAAKTTQEAARLIDWRPPFFPTAGGAAKRIGGVDGLWFSAHGVTRATLLYLHGGAYFAGSPRLYTPLLRAFARAGFDVFAPDYRLAPSYPFPAALDDARAVCSALRGAIETPLVLAGDSAGGGLALALMVSSRDAGDALPACAALFSPWTDLAVTGTSARENEARDALFTRMMLRIGARAYLNGVSAKNPLASPLYANLAGLPPLLVHVGADETLRDDSTRFIKKAQASRVEAEAEIWPGVPHGWQMMSFVPEARESLRKAIDFLHAHASRDQKSQSGAS